MSKPKEPTITELDRLNNALEIANRKLAFITGRQDLFGSAKTDEPEKAPGLLVAINALISDAHGRINQIVEQIEQIQDCLLGKEVTETP